MTERARMAAEIGTASDHLAMKVAVRSQRRMPAPFMPMPPDHNSNSHYCRQNQPNSKAEFSIHAIAGMPNAMIKPSRQTCQERMCTPAVKVPSASNVKTAMPVEVAFKTLCTLARNTMFITSRNAIQCSNCVAISHSDWSCQRLAIHTRRKQGR